MQYRILNICARIEGHAIQQDLLRKYCHDFQDWTELLNQAENHGMAPLLKKHLEEAEVTVPTYAKRTMAILYRRHQKSAATRLTVLEQILKLFEAEGLSPILLKGAALCLTLYPDPSLRPMRDIDLLFSMDEVDRAQELLRNAGFSQSQGPIPLDHHHLPALYKTVDGTAICFELHRGLYPTCPPYYPKVDFNELLRTANRLKVGNATALTFNNEETIHHLYQHGFRAPLTFEPYKLVNAADIISFVEKHFKTIDWHLIREQYPDLFRVLPLLHHISPWNLARVTEHFHPRRYRKRQFLPIPFNGWPQRRMKELEKETSFREIFKATFIPSSWWLRVYYGAGDSHIRYMIALLFQQPGNILWWARLYSHFVGATATTSDPDDDDGKGLRLFSIGGIHHILGVIQKFKDTLHR